MPLLISGFTYHALLSIKQPPTWLYIQKLLPTNTTIAHCFQKRLKRSNELTPVGGQLLQPVQRHALTFEQRMRQCIRGEWLVGQACVCQSTNCEALKWFLCVLPTLIREVYLNREAQIGANNAPFTWLVFERFTGLMNVSRIQGSWTNFWVHTRDIYSPSSSRND